jgi:hypothetical protein
VCLMPYPRTDCPTCTRNVAVAPKAWRLYRHDPPEGAPDLKSCPGSRTRWQPGPGEPGLFGDEPTLF